MVVGIRIVLLLVVVVLYVCMSFVGDLPQGGRHIPAYCCHRLFGPSNARARQRPTEPAKRVCATVCVYVYIIDYYYLVYVVLRRAFSATETRRP